MTGSMTKRLALCGLFIALATTGGVANAQGGYHHIPIHHARHAVKRQQAAYARAIARGDRAAAERAHLRARTIRHHVRYVIHHHHWH